MGFRVWGLKVWGLGFRVPGLGCGGAYFRPCQRGDTGCIGVMQGPVFLEQGARIVTNGMEQTMESQMGTGPS